VVLSFLKKYSIGLCLIKESLKEKKKGDAPKKMMVAKGIPSNPPREARLSTWVVMER